MTTYSFSRPATFVNYYLTGNGLVKYSDFGRSHSKAIRLCVYIRFRRYYLIQAPLLLMITGNILSVKDNIPVGAPYLGTVGGPSELKFAYDDLYRVTNITGVSYI